MVRKLQQRTGRAQKLSVLALSSRFDGPRLLLTLTPDAKTFSTRSVESF